MSHIHLKHIIYLYKHKSHKYKGFYFLCTAHRLNSHIKFDSETSLLSKVEWLTLRIMYLVVKVRSCFSLTWPVGAERVIHFILWACFSLFFWLRVWTEICTQLSKSGFVRLQSSQHPLVHAPAEPAQYTPTSGTPSGRRSAGERVRGQPSVGEKERYVVGFMQTWLKVQSQYSLF